MLKNQRQNLIMENEFHIKEERVKAQQSSAKTADSASKEEKSTAIPKIKTVKSEATDSKSSSAVTKEASKPTVPAVKPKPSLEVAVKKEGNPSVEPASKKNGEKTPKEKSSGKE